MTQPPTPPALPAKLPVWRSVSVGLGVLWFGFLLTMVLTSANPPTLNREQILDSESVLEAKVDDLASGKIQATKVHRGPDYNGVLVITNLVDTGAVQGETYLFPLTPENKGTWSVTLSPLPDTRSDKEPPPRLPLIYPVSASILEQLSELNKTD